VLLPTKALNIVRPFDASGEVEAQLCCCMYPALDGSVVAVRVGEGLKTVVAIVECGPDSNAEAFVQAANRASQAAPAMPPALASAYSAWFMGRLQQTGTMTGCGPRAPGIISQVRRAIATSGESGIQGTRHAAGCGGRRRPNVAGACLAGGEAVVASSTLRPGTCPVLTRHFAGR